MQNEMVEVNWLVNDFCNWKCTYCYPGSRSNLYRGYPDIKKIIESFDNSGKKWLIYMSGGEPFFFPNFIELCKGLTKNNLISINSNLTHPDVFFFAEEVDPQKVRCVHASIHIEERERCKKVDDIIKKYKLLESKGMYVYASYVLHPGVLKRFEKDYNYFKSNGIIIRPKVFRGSLRTLDFTSYINNRLTRKLTRILEKVYPDSYTSSEQIKIIDSIEKAQKDGDFQISHCDDITKGRISDVYLDKHFITGLPSYKGKYCATGQKFARMTPQGELYRCYDDDEYLGNLFDGTMNLNKTVHKCRADLCHCPYIGLRYVINKN